MSAKREIDPAGLAGRLEAVHGLDAVREAADGRPAYLVGGAVRDLLLGETARTSTSRSRRTIGPSSTRSAARPPNTSASRPRASCSATWRWTSPGRARRPTRSPGALPEVEPGDARRGPGAARLHGQRDGRAAGRAGRADRPPRRPRGPREGAAAGPPRPLLHGRPDPGAPGRPLRRPPRAASWNPSTAAAAAGGRSLHGLRGPRHRPSCARSPARRQPSAALGLIEEWGLSELRRRGCELVAAVERLLRRAPGMGGVRRPTVAILLAVATGDHPAAAAARGQARRGGARPHRRSAGTSPTATSRGCWRWPERPGPTGSTTTSTRLRQRGARDRRLRPARRRGSRRARGSAGDSTRHSRLELDGEISAREEELQVALEAAREASEAASSLIAMEWRERAACAGWRRAWTARGRPSRPGSAASASLPTRPSTSAS